MTTIIIMLIMMAIASAELNNSNTIVAIYNEPSGASLNHLVIDKNTGLLYVGAVNRLSKLSSILKEMENLETGPQQDSVECPITDCPWNVQREQMDNVNKALIIDYSRSQLISCGSVFQGMCSVHSLLNIFEKREVRESVAANNPTASTVAFVAPGPSKVEGGDVLYVGVSYTGNSMYRDEVPAIASRSLENRRLFQIAQSAATTGTRMFVNALSRETYPINYVYGFSSEGFSYFITTQLKEHSDSYHSKLIRVCQNDESYYSYTEIPIVCSKKGGKNYGYNLVQAAYVGKAGSVLAAELNITVQDDVLFAVFSQSESMQTNVPSDPSALCVYSLKAIRRKFLENIKKCFKGQGARGLNFISPSHPCTVFDINTISEDFCGVDMNTPLGGEQPVKAVPALLFNTQLTAVAATSTGDFTVVFIGTVRGHLKKVIVESPTSAFEYGDTIIDENSPVNKDLHFDPKSENVYVMTEKKISKVKVQDCTEYTNCLTCLSAKDPYCGWCYLENKCSLRSSCRNVARNPMYWVSYKNGRCATITRVTPSQLQRTTVRTLELIIDNLPNITGEFLCSFTFSDKPLITNAIRKNHIIYCDTPITDLLPSLPADHHHLIAKLSVKTASGVELVSTNLTFFDCSTFSSCSTCVGSSFPCDWRLDRHKCTHDTGENYRNDIFVTGVSQKERGYRQGPRFCPSINASIEGSNEILIPSGMKRAVTVKVHIIGQYIRHTQFLCQFNIEGRETSVNAQLKDDMIYCDSMEFKSRGPNATASLAVIWGDSKPLDNLNNLHVLIYRCNKMADNCGMCLELPEKFGCVWCQNSNYCSIKDRCSKLWFNRNHSCPNPIINSFKPKFGPWEGGTNITIEGINLGRNFSDIEGAVTVAGVSCRPIEKLYIEMKKIVCTVDGNGTSNLKSGPVVVHVNSYNDSKTQEEYKFVDPVIKSIFPSYGPKSGGTKVSITGVYLNAGSNIQAFIGDIPCVISRTNISTTINTTICQTSNALSVGPGLLTMNFDKGKRVLNNPQFEYVDDPIIDSMDFGQNQNDTPTGIPSGGIKIKVSGSHLQSVQQPRMYVYYDGKIFSGPCKSLTNRSMICESPVIDIQNAKLDAEKPETLEYGFLMDNVESVRNLSSKFGKFLLYPNPEYNKLDENVQYNKSGYLIIDGQNLDRACREKDVEVLIGNSNCNVTSLSRQQLTCRLPTQGELDPDNQNKVDVVVKVYYERVNSYSASATFAHAYCGFKDVSRNLILDSCGPITKIRFSKGFAFSNIEAASEFEDQRSRFFAEHERFDDCMEMREGLDLIGVSSFKEYMVAYRDTESLPWYSSHALFWVLSCLLLSWPLRILIECNTSYVHYTVTKIFGVNYDIENTRRAEMENTLTQYSPAMHCTRRPPPPPPPPLPQTEPVISSQMAILANGMNSNSSSMQHVNILALARSRNNLEQAAMMSHTSTIDSLELFASIRENCALVPSYSEALLLSSIDGNVPASGNSPRSSFNRRKSLDPNQRIAPSTSSGVNQEAEAHQSAIITTPRRKLRIVTEEDQGNVSSSVVDSEEDDDLETPYRIHATQSNYSLKTNNNYILIERDKNNTHYKFQNRKSWAGFLSKPNQCRGHGSARIRPIPLLSCRKNSLTDSLINDSNPPTTSNESHEVERRVSANVTLDMETNIENELPISQIEVIDRNLMEDEIQDEQNRNLYFASPLMKFCPDDPFGGRTQTTPTEDPPPYEIAVNLPVLRRITRSVTDRGELFGQSRAFINDTILNRRSCVDNVVSGTDAVRLLDNSLSNREKVNADVETNL